MGKKKLCRSKEWAEEKNREELLELLLKPKFFCKKCLRASADEKVLCKPEKLKSSKE